MVKILEKVASSSSCVENGEQSVMTILIFWTRMWFAVCWDSRAPNLFIVAPSTDGDLYKFGWTMSAVEGVNLPYSNVHIRESESTTADTTKMLVLFVDRETKVVRPLLSPNLYILTNVFKLSSSKNAHI